MFTEKSQRISNRIWILALGLLSLLLLCLTGCATTMHKTYGSVQSYSDGVECLSAYGEWVDYPQYGIVWLPTVASDWEPFYYGRWIWTVDGWAWTSDEPFGWIVYHYGSWGYQPGLGWFWVPDDTWYPACVQWYTFGDYAAWAPLPPPNIVWPDPWDHYEINIWIVVEIDNFENANIGQHRISRPVYKRRVQPETVVRRPPDVKRVKEGSARTARGIRIREQEVVIQTRVDSKSQETVKRREQASKKIVQPRNEKREAGKNVSRVERVIIPDRERTSSQQEESRAKSAERSVKPQTRSAERSERTPARSVERPEKSQGKSAERQEESQASKAEARRKRK